MTKLSLYVDNQLATISNTEVEIKNLQQSLEDTKLQLRNEKILLKGRETALVEIKNSYNNLTSLLRDVCSVLPVESLDTILEEITEIVESVKVEYSKYSMSDRFLNVETKTVEDADLKVTSFVSLPPVSDDKIVLTIEQLQMVLNDVEEDVLEIVKNLYNIPLRIKRLDSLALSFFEKQLTMSQFNESIVTATQMVSIKRKQLTSSN